MELYCKALFTIKPYCILFTPGHKMCFCNCMRLLRVVGIYWHLKGTQDCLYILSPKNKIVINGKDWHISSIEFTLNAPWQPSN